MSEKLYQRPANRP